MPSAYLAANIPGEPAPEDAGLTANIDPQKAATPLSNAQLMPADPQKGYSTPYYAAYTNDGDFAGAVMVADGQKIRLVDKLTGDVVYEGVGPQAAEIATATANSISKDKGRGAAWAIQKPTEDGGWVSMAEERYDPKKQDFWGKLADIALPIIGAMLGGPLGAAAGSAIASGSNRRGGKETLQRAAMSAALTYVGGKAVPMVGKALANAPQNAVTNALNTGYDAVMRPLNAGVNAVRGAAGATVPASVGAGAGAVSPVTVIGNSVVPAISGGAIGSTVAGLVPTSTALGPNAPAGALSQGADTLGGTEVEEVVVGGGSDALPGGALGAAVTPGADTGNTVEEVVVEPETAGGVVPGAVAGTIGSDVVLRGDTIPANVEDLKQMPQLDDKNRLLEWVKANPELAAKLGLNLASLLGGAAAGGGSTTGGGIPPGFATAGTPGSLSDKFRAQLPAPSGPFGNLAARDVAMTSEEWKTYGARPEQSFFANVPIRPSGIIEPPARRAPVTPGPSPAEAEPGLRANINPDVRVAPGYWPEPNSPTQPVSGANQPKGEAVFRDVVFDGGSPVPPGWVDPYLPATAPTSTSTGFNPTAPSSVNSTSGSDMNRGGMTAEQFAVAMKRMEDARRAPPLPTPSKGFKVGGFAVRGPGTGRSDDIPARLSDGEYVIDAETVALLGDGSSQAGSKRLDEFRANIRKHKGRQLAKGKFSHDARKPEAYLHGGRV